MADLPVVRDYVLYDNRITDRRTGPVANPDKFLDGRIDDNVQSLIRYRAQKRHS